MLKAKKIVWVLCVFVLCGCGGNIIVIKPVADIRRIPLDRKAGLAHDDMNETQALYNEVLAFRGENKDWYQVEAIEQKEFSHEKRWQGYPGWIRKQNASFTSSIPKYNIVVIAPAARVLKAATNSAEVLIVVSLGTKFQEVDQWAGFYKVILADQTTGWISQKQVARIDEIEGPGSKRRKIISEAMFFVGKPYLWGGRSIFSVDCSGMVNLIYRASGVDIPRDAHEQWMMSRQVTFKELQPGDLIFLSKKDDFGTIGHVMLFLGNDAFIEAPGTGKTVRVGHLKDYEGSGKKMYFGRILK